MKLSSDIQTWLKHAADIAANIRNSKSWPLIRPFYQIAKKLITIKNLTEIEYKTILAHKKRLYELGFTEKSIRELERFVSDNIFRTSAAWELALWHANQNTADDKNKCLKYLQVVLKNERKTEKLRHGAILEAECCDFLENFEKAREILKKTLLSQQHADLYLAAANLETSLSDKICLINKAFELNNIPAISYKLSSELPYFDLLMADLDSRTLSNTTCGAAKVTIIIPAFNAENTISTAINCLLSQSWKNLEIQIVDDCSMDSTVRIIQDYTLKDARIRLIQTDKNQGPYVARNIALKEATGDFITCHDADDWSHPQKIFKQVTHLLENPSAIANTSELSRATNDLKFFRRGNPGNYIQVNMSSLMFRRKPVIEKVGFWDCVRFGADGEFVRRLKHVFGKDAVTHLRTGPLSFLRQTSDSLTGNRYFGYHGYFMGARKEYGESFDFFHRKTNNFYFNFPQIQRPFPAPGPLLPHGNTKHSRHFDVIMVSDFRLPGGTTASNIEEIKAQTQTGLHTGLVQMSRYDIDPSKEVNAKVRELIDGDKVEFIVYGEKVSCDVLILRHPPILQEPQRFIPCITTNDIRVIINQTPLKHYGSNARIYYDIKKCIDNLNSYFNNTGIWYPIGPLIRSALLNYHSEELKYITLSDHDWHNIIDVSHWQNSTKKQNSKKVIIGRHSRDDIFKWPGTRNEILSIYPDSAEYEVNILGGAEAPKKILGYLPKNWKIFEFDSVHPRDFLSQLDVFVYFTHPDLVESFGRVIFEAMAVGVPVIIPKNYRKLFGDAAIYAEPVEVKEKIHQLMSNDRFYNLQVEKASDYVEKQFGYAKHLSRIKKKYESQSRIL